MAAAIDLGGNLNTWIAAANVKRTDTLGPVNLVRRQRQYIDVHGVDVDGNLADSLNGIGVEDDALLVTQLADFRHRLDDADLVVGKHDRNQDGLVVDGPLQVFDVDQTVGLHRQIRHAVAVLFKPLAGIEHRFVLGHLGDDVIAALLVHLGDALDGEVVALGRARGEDDLLCRRADQFGDLLAGVFNGLFGFPAKGVIAAGGIAELSRKKRDHRFEHTRIHGASRVVIHIDGQGDACGYGIRIFQNAHHLLHFKTCIKKGIAPNYFHFCRLRHL